MTATATARFSTHTGPVVRATLPLPWTETYTPLPSATFTATPVTPTVTLTPVPSLADLCASFEVTPSFADGHSFGWDDTIILFFGTTLQTVRDPDTQAVVPLTVRFLATHPLSGENLGAQLDGGQVFGMELPINSLPRPGYYTWKAWVEGDGIGERCVHQGFFFVYRAATEIPPN